jgi:hypothetical protein
MTLVFVPFHDKKRYCIEELLDWLRDADLPDTEIFMRIHGGRYGEKDAVKNQREWARKYAVEKGFSHLFMVGADTIPPLDALPKLLARNVDVVGGVYYGRPDAESPAENTATVWKHSDKSFHDRKNLETLTDLQVVDGMGNDCVLFSKKAFESFTYFDWQGIDDDYPCYDLLKSKGFKIYLDPLVVCKHYSGKGKFT